MADKNYYNNNIGLLSLKNDNQFINQMNNIAASQSNNSINLSPYIDTNLNINNLLYLNSYNQNMSNINLNNSIGSNINKLNNNKNNIYNNIQNKNYNNNNLIKPYFSNINMLIASHSLTKANDLIYKDLQQLENILSNYKLYIINNNFDAIDLCLKYILETNFFFNKVVTNKLENILKNY